MFFASRAYKDVLFFGGYPTEEWLDVLLSNRIKIFVDTTTEEEKASYSLPDYRSKIQKSDPENEYYHFPIVDNNIPIDIGRFKEFVFFLSEKIMRLEEGEKVYIHCKGGHGRSGMVVACVLCYLLNIYPEKALHLTTVAHSERENLRPKWKNVRCPQTFRQRKFVIDVFRPIVITPSMYEEKIGGDRQKLPEFLEESSLRPLSDKTEDKILSSVLIHLRRAHMKKSRSTSSLDIGSSSSLYSLGGGEVILYPSLLH
jgi:hypothetical protein